MIVLMLKKYYIKGRDNNNNKNNNSNSRRKGHHYKMRTIRRLTGVREMQIRSTSIDSCTYTSTITTTTPTTVNTLIVASMVLLLLLSFATLIQNQLLPSLQQSSSSSPLPPIPSLVHADKIKVKNKSLINAISDQLVNLSSGSKDELQNILQQIQAQIALTAGQDKATNVIKQIKSVIELNPNGPLSQSLLF